MGTALRNLVDNINSGNYSDAASLMSENFIQNVLEVWTRNEVPAYFERAQPIDLRSVGNPLFFADGRLSIDVVDMGLFGGLGRSATHAGFSATRAASTSSMITWI